MTDLLDHHSSEITKTFIVGKQGTGKTGLIASAVAIGYKAIILDFDNGVDILKNLLTSYKYPYRKYMEDNKIPLRGAVNICTISEQMIKHKTENRFVPKSASGWTKMVDMLEHWKDGEIDLGPAESWGSDTILVLDTFGTCSDLAYFHIQALNGRLGARQEGYDYQRDVGGAQGILKNLLQKLFSKYIQCNVLINSHITWVDESKGISERPRSDGVVSDDPTGYPSAIGRALSPVAGKYFNNVLMVEQSGQGITSKHEIVTVPAKGVSIKSSAPGILKPRYSVETGLAEILCTLSGKDEPKSLTDMFAALKPKVTSIPGATKPQAA
jgi:hypothetical protein